ncbi:unnamed protein product [Lathyrus sativus]|nr:unnamed protein product [Lathyrus sativus]
MLAVTFVSYRFNICGKHSNIMKAKRGLRQCDLVSPLLFVMIMEYLHKSIHKLNRIPNFNFHAKCEKHQIINIAFADHLLLFDRGDCKYVELLMEKMRAFSNATGLFMNPCKCKAYFGGVHPEVKNQIICIIGFVVGDLPFRYLDVPLTSRKLAVHNCMGLVDIIIKRIRHGSLKLLSYACRVQLINNTLSAMTSY